MVKTYVITPAVAMIEGEGRAQHTTELLIFSIVISYNSIGLSNVRRLFVPLGEIVKLTHITRGVENGKLLVDIVVTGSIPEFPQNAEVTLEPYEELYIQTGPGKSLGQYAIHF